MGSRRIMLVIYKERDNARQMLDHLERMNNKNVIQIEGAVVIDKEIDGTIRIDNKEDISAGLGALVGAITGGIVGLLGGVGGAIVGAAAGTVTGSAAASAIDLGMDKNVIEGIKTELTPGMSVLAAVVEEEWLHLLEQVFDSEIRAGAAHFYHEIKAETVEQWAKGGPKVMDLFDEDDDTV